MNPIVSKLLTEQSGALICWTGNAGWLIGSAGLLVAFDLDLDSPGRDAPPPVSASEVAASLEILFITHEHGDHFNWTTASTLAKQSQCLFVLPANCVSAGRSMGIPDNRIRIARPREPLDLEGLHVQPLRAFHGDRDLAVYSDANLDDCGYVLTIGGLTFFQPGDSVLTKDHLALSGIDVLFVSPTIHNMHVQPATTLIHKLRPRYVFPQHFGTYAQTEQNSYWTCGYPVELRQALDPEMRSRYHQLEQGQVFRIE